MNTFRRTRPLALLALALALPLWSADRATEAQLQSIQKYIKETWKTLTRSNRQLAGAAADPKFQPSPEGRWPVYFSRNEDGDAVREKLRAELPPADLAKLDILPLPEDPTKLQQQGLLYLPRPYVVPGGRFNEMYGWDSYFIQAGLLLDNETALAKDMADNFLYEIRNYGKILNANRTYYLNRSQPPFLTQMLLGVYEKTADRAWLEAAVPDIESTYRLWTTGPHVRDNGLSRYWDFGEGPAPEVLSAEKDAQGRNHYELVKDYYRTHKVTDYELGQFYDRKTDQLTPLFYKGDRSMRESGFDPSNRFGPFNADIIHYNPVCLNSLLYLMERQAGEIAEKLNRAPDAAEWRKRAAVRAAKVNSLMWDERDGLYYDYNFQIARVRRYPFLTTFYPLWAGIATREQAARVARNLPLFELPGGLETSTVHSGNQWDAPFGWAPLEMIAVEGLRRYGYEAEANRISAKWLSMVLADFLKTGRIVEKYDVAKRGSDVSGGIGFGYRSNEAGFGWTNGVFLRLYQALPQAARSNVLRMDWNAAASAAGRAQ